MVISWTDPYSTSQNDFLVGRPGYKLVLKDNASGKILLSKDVTGTTSLIIDKSLLQKGHYYSVAIMVTSGSNSSDPNYMEDSDSSSTKVFYIDNV